MLPNEIPKRKRELWNAKYYMLGFTLLERNTGLIEAVCSHGIGHPIPESVKFLEIVDPQPGSRAIHGCDGCCSVFWKK